MPARKNPKGRKRQAELRRAQLNEREVMNRTFSQAPAMCAPSAIPNFTAEEREILRRCYARELQQTTPVELFEDLLRFCREIAPGSTPLFLEVEPPDWSRAGFCDLNVERMISLGGGRAVRGYKIWTLDKLMAEAEPHAVWEGPDGVLHDITYNVDGETRILFVPCERLTTVSVPIGEVSKEAFDPVYRGLMRKTSEFVRQRVRVEFRNSWEDWEQSPSYRDWLALAGKKAP